jgi:hypothetical protein
MTEPSKSAAPAPTAFILLTSLEQEALAFLLPLSEDYPDFELWFRTKVVSGLRLGTRKIIRIERRETLVGIGIVKKEEAEKKICTVRIDPLYFGRGLGLKIFDSCLLWLNTDKPHLTVSERKLPAFERIFDRYGFIQTSERRGRYLPSVTEFGYNDQRCVGLERADKV